MRRCITTITTCLILLPIFISIQIALQVSGVVLAFVRVQVVFELGLGEGGVLRAVALIVLLVVVLVVFAVIIVVLVVVVVLIVLCVLIVALVVFVLVFICLVIAFVVAIVLIVDVCIGVGGGALGTRTLIVAVGRGVRTLVIVSIIVLLQVIGRRLAICNLLVARRIAIGEGQVNNLCRYFFYLIIKLF